VYNLINGDGNGNVVINRKALLPIGFVILIIGACVSGAVFLTTLNMKVNFIETQNHAVLTKLSSIEESVYSIDNRLTRLEAIAPLGMNVISELQTGDNLYVETPYDNLAKQEIWIDLEGVENGHR